MNKYLVFDIENDNTNMYKRNAGNFMYDNIVAIGLKPFDGESEAFYEPTSGLEALLDIGEYNLLVGHNIKHDLLFLWYDRGLQTFIKNGGRIWDTQLVEYYLSSFQNTYPSLRDIAVQRYGCKQRPKHIDNLLFDVPVKDRIYQQVSDIPADLVLEDVMNDVLDTENIYLQQLQKVQQLGLLEAIQIQMDYLLSTTEMEYNGFYTDLELLKSNRQELQDRLDPLKAGYEKLVDKYVPIQAFKDQPKKGLHLLLFGGDLKTVEKRRVLDEDGLPVMVKTGLSKGQPKFKNEEIITKIPGLGMTAQPNWKTDKGNISIDESVLKEIVSIVENRNEYKDVFQICSNLLELRNIEKQVSTYFDAIEELVYSVDNCIHGKIHHVSTGTGRTSSSNPNMQNFPRKGNSKVKEQFKTRY